MTKKFFLGFFYYRNKYINNIEVGRIVLEYCVNRRRKNSIKDNYSYADKIELAFIRVYDQKDREFIIEVFEKNTNAVLSDTIFNVTNSLKDMQNEIGKCGGILKIKKSSNLYKFVKNNSKIFCEEIEPEDYFYYYVQNIKSDFYILRNKETENEKENDLDCKYRSLSSENFFKNNSNEIINKKDSK